MANWILTAKENVPSPANANGLSDITPEIRRKAKDLKKGYTIIVAAPSTGGPSNEDVLGALLVAGFFTEEATRYVSGSWRQNFEGKEIGETDFKLYDKQFEAQSYAHREEYSYKRLSEKKDKQRKKIEEKAEKDREKSKDKKGCCPSSSICDSIIDSIPGLRCSINSITCVFGSLSD